jgi:hypothetical protein
VRERSCGGVDGSTINARGKNGSVVLASGRRDDDDDAGRWRNVGRWSRLDADSIGRRRTLCVVWSIWGRLVTCMGEPGSYLVSLAQTGLAECMQYSVFGCVYVASLVHKRCCLVACMSTWCMS